MFNVGSCSVGQERTKNTFTHGHPVPTSSSAAYPTFVSVFSKMFDAYANHINTDGMEYLNR
ncbi:MAG: hypothetical protein D8M52_08945 [Chlorobi bacterium]|nr:hypothetical protein [Chlorobiota bacterium]